MTYDSEEVGCVLAVLDRAVESGGITINTVVIQEKLDVF